jgi:hypothetical protein
MAAAPSLAPQPQAGTVGLLGCDFSSSPSRRKPGVLAVGRLDGGTAVLDRLERFDTLDGLRRRLEAPGRWVGGFDLPFGLPRELVEHLGWPTDWRGCMRHYAALSRAEIRAAFAAFCDARPAGGKFAHRATDRLAGSSPSMKWVNPPVAYMLHAGVPLLLAAGAHLAGVEPDDPAADRVALEAYPGLPAREVLGRRSYKSDDRAKQTADRRDAREALVAALERGAGPAGPLRLGLRLRLERPRRAVLVDDASGDSLDAVLCLLQAAWGLARHRAGAPRYGLPPDVDPLEGWIVSA